MTSTNLKPIKGKQRIALTMFWIIPLSLSAGIAAVSNHDVGQVVANPQALAQSLATMDNRTVAITLKTQNFITVPEYAVVENPTHGSLTGVPPLLIYRPTLGFSGVDSFVFEARDEQGNSRTATIAIRIRLNTANWIESLPQFERVGQSAVELAGKMYIFGGYSYDRGETTNDLLVYDPAAGGTWHDISTPAAGVIPAARTTHSAVVIDGKMYVFGGGKDYNPFDDFHVYDPATGGSWTNISVPSSGTMPGARFHHSAVTIDGKMYVFGGENNAFALNDLHVYDPAEGGRWTDISVPTFGSPPTARYGHTAVAIDGKMYVFGGSDGSDGKNDLYVYDPKAGGRWTDISVPTSGLVPAVRVAHSAVAIDGKMYIFGGSEVNFSYDLNDLYVYDPAVGGSWTTISTPASGSPPSERGFHSAAPIAGKMYIFGGNIGPSGLFIYSPN